MLTSIIFHDLEIDVVFFTVTIDEDYDRDDIENAIDDVCDEYDLWIDDDSDGDFDLCERYND